MTLEIEGRLRETVCRHLEAAYPEEGCGILLGLRGREADVVLEVVPIPNAHEARRVSYRMAPEMILDAERRAREAGREIVGFFHSHPDRPASPSPADREQAWPGVRYLIVSVVGGRAGELGAYSLEAEGGPLLSVRLGAAIGVGA